MSDAISFAEIDGQYADMLPARITMLALLEDLGLNVLGSGSYDDQPGGDAEENETGDAYNVNSGDAEKGDINQHAESGNLSAVGGRGGTDD